MEDVLDRVREGRKELIPDKEAAPTSSLEDGGFADDLFTSKNLGDDDGPDDDEDWLQDEAPARGKRKKGRGKN